MRCKKYSVIVCIVYAWLVVIFSQGFELQYSTIRTNVEVTTDGTTGHEFLPKFPEPSVTIRTDHEEITTARETDEPTLIEIVQNTMYKLCPYGQYCRTSPPNTSRDEYEDTCCTDCSCNETCSVEENKVCCFPKLDLPENVTIMQMECLPATFSMRSLPDSVILPRYNMVTYCPPRYLEPSEENKVMVQSCKDDTLIQSLRPVFSKSTKLIYKNKFCAQCHGETHFISWTPYLICTGESIQVEISKGFLSPNCYIRFKYPGDMLDIQFHRCCLPTFSNISSELSLDSDTVLRLCEHGIYAPFSYINNGIEEVFVNIYCAICNSISYDGKCTKKHIDFQGTIGTYLGFLDISLLDDKSETKVMHTKTPKLEACRALDSVEDTCRELLCKSGQVLNQAGQCVYVSLNWRFENVHVILKLSHRTDLTKCSFYDLIDSTDVDAHLKSGWPASWTLHSFISGKPLCNCTRRLVTKCDPYIVVVYWIKYYKHSNQTFPEFLISVNKFMSEPWYLEINGSYVNLTSEFLNLNSVKDDAMWFIRNNPFHVIPYVKTSTLSSSFQITKLFFCEQISLHEVEYDIYKIKYHTDEIRFIYSREHGKIFLPSEYVLHEREDGSVYPRVCVTDTLFQKVTKSNAGSRNYRKIKSIFVIIFVIIICCHLI